MDNISDVSIGPCENSIYVKPKRVHYKQNGVEKTWDVMKIHDGVAILVLNTTRNVFIMVKQFRPAIYMNSVTTEMRNGVEIIDTDKYPGSVGMTLELCAGIVDKDEPIEKIAKIELLEECGYDVPLKNIRKITSNRGGVGVSGNTLHLYYAEVTDDMKVGPGGGNPQEGELIDVVEIGVEESRQIMFDESINKVHLLLFAMYWFFDEIWSKRS